MFCLLFLLIAQAWSVKATEVTLVHGLTGDLTDGCKAGTGEEETSKYQCDTLTHSIARMRAEEGDIAELQLTTTAMDTTDFTSTITGTLTINPANIAAALTLTAAALTIGTLGDDGVAGTVTVSTVTVTIGASPTEETQFASVVNGALTLKGVTFTWTQTGATKSYLKKSLIDVQSGTSLTLEPNTATTPVACSFSGIYSEESGAAIHAVYDGAALLFKPVAKYTDCCSQANGGAIYVEITAAPTTAGNLVLNTGLSFGDGTTGNAVNDALLGANIYLKTNNSDVKKHGDVTAQGAAQIAAGKSASNNFVLEDNGATCAFFEANVIHVKTNATGSDTACGTAYTDDEACPTIAKAIGCNLYGTNKYRAVSVASSLALETVVALSTNSLDVFGTSATNTISVNNITLFTLSTGTLIISTLTFDYAAAVSSYANEVTENGAQLLSVTDAGYVKLTSVTVTTALSEVVFKNSVIKTTAGVIDIYGMNATGLTLNNVPLFDLAGTFSFNKAGNKLNNFANIERTGCTASNNIVSGGAVFVLSGASLNLDNIVISNCISTAAEGVEAAPKADAIFFTPSSAPSFSFTDCTFTPANTSSAVAKFIYINAGSAANLPTYQSLASFFWGSSSASGLIVRAPIAADDEENDVDMSTAGVTIVMGTHEDGANTTWCGKIYGDVDVKCASLEDVSKSNWWKDGHYKEVAIASGLGVETTGLNISGYLAITGAGPMTFKLASGALFTLSANAYEVDVTGCTFTYNDGTADTTNAEPVEISTPVFKLSGANNVLILTNVTIGVDETKNNVLLTTEAIIYSAGTVTIDGCTFEGINRKDDCLLNPSPVKDAFVMKNTNTFKTIAITGYGSGAAMATTLSDAAHAVVITGATFESCTSVGNAGALAFQITAGSLTVSKCTFTNCGATKSTKEGESFSGYGGALGIVIASGTPSFTFSELAFTGCTAATAGSVVAVMCPEDYMKTAYPSFAEFIKLGRTANVAVYGTVDENGTLTPNDLYKLIPETAKVDATNGEDSTTCGEVDEEASKKACKSFAGALATYYKLVTKIEMTNEKYTEETAAQWTLSQTMSIKGTAAEETKTDRTSLTLKNYLANMAETPYVFYIGNNLNTMTITIADITINVVSNYDAETNLELFYVSTGATLELNNVGIANDTTSKKIQTVPIIDATNGKVSLTSVTFDKFYMKEVSLLNIPADHFSTFTLCNFNGITKESGAGSVLNLAIVDGMNFNLAENNFTSCKTLNGNGGAVYINYNKGNLTIGNQEFNQTKKNCTTLFKSCSAGAPAENDDTNADAPTAGAGGAIYLNLESVDEEKYLLNITSILIEDCTAAKGGNAMYAHATTEEGTKLLENKNFWSVLTKINGNKKDEFTIMDNEGNEEKPKGSSSGFPIWAIIVIVVVVVVVIVIVVVIIVCCCCRSSS